MENENKKKNSRKRQRRKLAGLFALTGITALVLIVETYAWFIGTGSIQTSEFQIGVSTEKSLFLSLDGENWSENLTISKENILALLEGTSSKDNHNAYENHTNKWVDENVGLIPISTSGDKDLTVSRLKLFGKSSITATPGGFRLISTRLDNYSEAADGEETPDGYVAERDGYVAFDLFIKNGEGVDYIEKYNEEDDEAIYLTTNSAVSVVKSGDSNEQDYGLANSVRVAFAQIGRVASATATTEEIIGMVCSPENSGTDGEDGEKYPVKGEQTGLCKETKTTIWEPNDKAHDAELIKYFGRVCKGREVERDEDGKVTTSTYGVNDEITCMTITDGNQVPTYVVNQNILSSDFVDVYDGLNGYEIEELEGYKISKYPTFTDSDKILKDEERPAFFKLAANSVTKIRVYIYLEGQDVDNYDLISLGKTIKINFGFTKDQFDLSNPSQNTDNPEENA